MSGEKVSIQGVPETMLQTLCARAKESKKEPVLIIIESLTMYLSEADVKRIFSIIDSCFACAAIWAETMSPFVVKHIKEKSIEGSQARFSWGVKNG